MILVDTCVWRRHFRQRDERLAALLDAGSVLCHPWILGELLLGSGLPAPIAHALANMPRLPVAAEADVLRAIERWRLGQSGLSMVDVHLLVAAVDAGVEVYTHDRALGEAMARFRPGGTGQG